MAFRKTTYGINFPFTDSVKGDFLDLTDTPDLEIKSNLVHLLLTKKGSRFMLPDFGTNLYQYIFEPLDDSTIGQVENEIHDAVEKYIPNLKINKIIILRLGDDGFLTPDDASSPFTIKIRLDYSITSRTFELADSVTIGF